MLNLLIYVLSFFPWQENPVSKPVKDLFRGMETNDSTLVRSAFLPGGTMLTITWEGDETHVKSGNLSDFLAFIGKPKEYTVAEPIWNIEIRQDGAYATLWADYALYVDGKMNHCGIDSFELVQSDGEWKILSITDTRRKENCEVPADIVAKYGSGNEN